MIPKSSMLRLLLFSFFLDICSRSHAELFTAISEVEPLLVTHKRIIDDLDFYIEQEEQRLVTLKRHLNIYKKEHEKAMEDIPNYLGNPINAFTLIKRLTTDLDLIEDSIKIGTECSRWRTYMMLEAMYANQTKYKEYIKNITMNHDDVKYPTLEDLTGAAQALTRLRDTYRLDVRELSEGILNGVKYSTPMTPDDCYELGRALYNDKDFKNALPWMLETYRKYQELDEKERENMPFTEVDILEYIGFAHYLLGETEEALEWTYKLLKLDPKHPRAHGNVPHFKKLIQDAKAEERKLQRGDIGDPRQDFKPEELENNEKEQKKEEEKKEDIKVDNDSVGTWNYSYHRERSSYEALCRGEMDISADISKRLKCWYSSDNHSFLKYAPIKVEQMYIKPDIFIFHEVLTDDEIEVIKDMAKPRFKRAVVHDPKTGELIPAQYRISKSAWLKNEESPDIARVSQRVEDMTGLDMRSAEELQVVNYGIGGHYEPHFDFARSREKAFAKFDGNRIATVLFYMSDVAQGGATVFTELGLSLFPIKRAAAFWLNLHPSGEGDLATRHAACPVLRGSKWVCNKWLHQGGQELIRPCTLEYQAEGIYRKLPTPVPKTSR